MRQAYITVQYVKYGLVWYCNVMIGSPGDRELQMLQIIRLLRRLTKC